MNHLRASLKSTSRAKDANGSFEAILSVPTLDRDGEVVDAKAFEPLPDHITIDVDHGLSVEKTIGSGVPFYDGDVLKIKGAYASTPLGQMVRTLVDEGHVRSMSVFYMNALYEVDEKDGLPHLRKAELLNAGIVGIPANREALITASKSFGVTAAEIAAAPVVDLTDDRLLTVAEARAFENASPVAKAGARHSAKDQANLQAAHDALVELGAECDTKSSEPEEGADETTDTEQKAAAPAPSAAKAPEAPAAPAGVNVDVAKAKARAAVAAIQGLLTLNQ